MNQKQETQFDRKDERIIKTLGEHENGCDLKYIATETGLKQGTVRYRLLLMQLCGIVRISKQRDSTTYFLEHQGGPPQSSTAKRD